MVCEEILDPVYILIRTSGRPKFFKRMMETIKKQTYKNIITIVHTDDINDKYVEGDIIIHSEKKESTVIGSAPYNLYCNTLLSAIPEREGWFHFMDDDDEYYHADSIKDFVKNSKRDMINIARVDRGEGNIWPKYWKGQKSFQTQCFLLHTDHKNKAQWWDKRAGDHFYSKQLTNILKINWIDNLIVARAQEGKGRGMKYDAGQAPRNKKKEMIVPVYYIDRVRTPSNVRGEAGEIKIIPRKIAENLSFKKIVKMIDKQEYNTFISNIMSR